MVQSGLYPFLLLRAELWPHSFALVLPKPAGPPLHTGRPVIWTPEYLVTEALTSAFQGSGPGR